MEVIEKQCALLSNYEVYKFNSECEKKVIQSGQQLNNIGNLRTIELETLNYFKNTKIAEQTDEKIINYLEKLKAYSLTKAEKLQILNVCPDKEVDLYLIIEESEERFTPEQITEMLAVIQETLIGEVQEDQEGQEGQEVQEDQEEPVW
ncbi:DNA-directed RNA polymerase III subunit RPC9 [Zancudomyces culisetae]|uniref:DNA-directed RNA polymerase III subunit RPC9 n=1 Tax=Zancudomyces culisetae TaxID=1213189 RepID=A0A1R1PXC4_ZANCU|nr:DNA-directed RNA polymerase III subunit RPC9 [Zancudomyces culisetae]|eukprot:OMH85621.1 DNA-directed RNA polymerase III subunit RPC9 [Zancudomyces culisetae]